MRSLGAGVREGGVAGYEFTKPRENDHETYQHSTSLCVRALKHVRTRIHKSYKYRSGVRTHSAAHSMNYGRYYDSYGQYYGNPNNRGGLVGGADAGIGGYGQYYGSPNNRGGWVGGSNAGTGGYNQYYGNPNNRGGLVGGLDAGTYRP